MNKKIKILLGVMIICLLVVSACQSTKKEDDQKNEELVNSENKENNIPKNDEKIKESLKPSWITNTIKTVNTNEQISIDELADKPLLIEPFAVWCPKCTAQQKEIKKLHEEVGDSIISLGLNVDPNEDENKVMSHLEENGFNWRYSVASKEFTQNLIDEFGVGIVNAPSGPMILVCPDKSIFELDKGYKTADFLIKEVAIKCGA
ncbi:redoxin domain-containing protein [Candidatus Woesearchaeota archaeon]|nr:redoxin domain-containing protein [Candidatus Woesearchaeota archaeon]MCF7901030.1 redoxin domain-containing protein [Candidatus Woesearchaeota archaeon]MCF8013389.1 redoxin domain-containing protein [Candidatus Woesearchaeota archaeon]